MKGDLAMQHSWATSPTPDYRGEILLAVVSFILGMVYAPAAIIILAVLYTAMGSGL